MDHVVFGNVLHLLDVLLRMLLVKYISRHHTEGKGFVAHGFVDGGVSPLVTAIAMTGIHPLLCDQDGVWSMPARGIRLHVVAHLDSAPVALLQL